MTRDGEHWPTANEKQIGIARDTLEAASSWSTSDRPSTLAAILFADGTRDV